MHKVSKRFSAYFLLVLIVISCAGQSDKVKYDIKMPVNDPAKLSSEAKKIWQDLDAGKEVSFAEVTAALVKSQAAGYSPSEDRTADVLKLTEEAKSQSVENNFHKRKVKYEAWLAKKSGTATVYNVKANTLFHFLLENKMQCYSGTVLNQVINRKSAGPRLFRDENWVAIFESGHILSGYLKKVGGEWHLFGIETTAEGEAIVEYGEVNEASRSVRIVDAEYWALSELFKNELKDTVVTVNAVVDYTAKRYGIKSPMKLESEMVLTAGPGEEKNVANYSPFGFGAADVAEGDVARQRFDSRKRTTFGRNPNPASGGPLGSYGSYGGSVRPSAGGFYGSGHVSEIQRLAQLWGSHVVTLKPDSEFCKASLTTPALAPFCTKEGAQASRLAEYAMAEKLERLSEAALVELAQALQHFE